METIYYSGSPSIYTFIYYYVNPICTGLFKPAADWGGAERAPPRYNFSALCRVGLKFVFPHNFFIAVTSEKKNFLKIERCVNPRPAVMTGVKNI